MSSDLNAQGQSDRDLPRNYLEGTEKNGREVYVSMLVSE